MNKHTQRFTSRLAVGGISLLVMTALTGAVAQAATGTPTPAPAKHVTAPKPVTTATPKSAGHAPAKIPANTKPRHLAAKPAVRATVASSALAPTTCTLAGTTRTCDLYAKAGTVTLSGATAAIPIWSFTLSDTDTPVLPGAQIIANQNETLVVNLHDELPAADGQVSLEIPAIAGVQHNGLATYTYTLSNPGTFVYEAAAASQGARQVAMGLAGMLVVRPALNPATDLGTPDTGFTAEAAVAVQEIDPVFNNNPLSTDLSQFNPQFFLINGHVYGDASATPINVTPADTLLLRYVNLGLRDREISLLNHRQTLVEQDSSRLTNPVENDVEFLTAGGTASTITHIDPTLHQGDSLALYDNGRHLYNGTTDPGLAGMMAILTVNSLSNASAAGPAVQVSVSPSVYDASVVQPGFAASVTTVYTPSAGITGQGWAIDQVPSPNTSPAWNAIPGGQAGCAATFCLNLSDIIGALPAGDALDGEHVIWVHATVDGANWGVSGDMITINGSGPVATRVQLHRPRTNATSAPNDLDGTNDVGIIATAAAALPGWFITDAQYCVDYPTCTLTGSLIVNPTAAPCTNHYTSTGSTSFTDTQATDPAAGWSPNQWTGYTVVAGISTSVVTANDGTNLTVGPWTGTTPANGTAFTIQVTAGAADSPIAVCGWIPAAAVSSLSEGLHTVSVRVQQSDGTNTSWGSFALPTASATLVHDTQGPIVIATPTVLPNPNNGFQASTGNIGWLDSIQVQATFDDSTMGNSPIVLAEAFLGGSTPTAAQNGAGAEMVPANGQWSANVTQQAYAYLPLADLRAMSDGIVPIYIHAQDAAGNWGPFTTINLTLDKTAPTAPGGCPAPATTCGPTVNIANGPTANQRVLTISASDPTVGGVSTGVNGAEIFVGADPGPGNGLAVPGTTSPFTATVSWGNAPVAGTIYLGKAKPTSIHARARDAAGNWSPVSSGTVV